MACVCQCSYKNLGRRRKESDRLEGETGFFGKLKTQVCLHTKGKKLSEESMGLKT